MKNASNIAIALASVVNSWENNFSVLNVTKL